MTQMTTTLKQQKLELLDEYYALLAPLAHDAGLAVGSRATDTDVHDSSRKFTTILTEYATKGGSLNMMADSLNLTYSALRRRVMTSELTPLPRSTKSTAPLYMYEAASLMLASERQKGSKQYHVAIKRCYDSGLSLNKLARYVGLTSAYPLYYGLNKARLAENKG